MKALAEELDIAGVPYIWYVFTSDSDCIHSKNVIFLPERLDVYKWIQECDALVQLSDTEACSYSIAEALSYNKNIIVTPLPYLNELSDFKEKILKIDFDLKNIKDIVEKIKSLKNENNSLSTNYCLPYEDCYKKYLVEGHSKYTKELRDKMLKIRAIVKFRDMKHNSMMRYTGEEFIEDEARAKDLVDRGFAVYVEQPKKVEVVEQAIPVEVKKEKAVKEKAIKEKPAKEVKKNAKK